MIQKITLSKGQVLTKSNITNILNNARSTFQYARFNITNKIYLTIVYNKDNTIEIMTNSRDLSLWNQINLLRVTYTQARVIEFVFRFINKLNR